MDNSDDPRDREDAPIDRDEAEEADRAPGDILGLSRVSTGGGGEAPAGQDDDAHQPPMPEERSHVGSRDVTDGTTGGTGPDTGGTGVFRRGSGATGTDIGR